MVAAADVAPAAGADDADEDGDGDTVKLQLQRRENGIVKMMKNVIQDCWWWSELGRRPGHLEDTSDSFLAGPLRMVGRPVAS